MTIVKRELIAAWWTRPGGVHSIWRVAGELIWSMSGYARWAIDPKAPNLHDLNESTKVHVRKYA